MPELPVEFIERRWPELFPSLSDPTLYTDHLGQFNDGNVATLILAQKRLDDEKRRFVHILKEWDAEHEKRDNEDQRRHRSSLSKVRANISQRHSWDDVMKELERVQDDYNNPKGFGRVRKVVRKVAAKSERIEPFIAFIPNGDYTSVICGGLRFILGVGSLERVE
ncbi:hypothetical protein SAMD00023353_5300240 [Rosellinia necatrix]|uniref:Uncharacterized protein n=1 Tax=Rosellinia necatrix TaxID=77044 RepID=A0A1S8A9S3_ROSNE|nr:hypothetical protein SAMD00023353_5300240 [Rosellinia necatrix]